jgi:hypothetical protein
VLVRSTVGTNEYKHLGIANIWHKVSTYIWLSVIILLLPFSLDGAINGDFVLLIFWSVFALISLWGYRFYAIAIPSHQHSNWEFPIEYEFGDKDFTTTNGIRRIKTPWSAIVRWKLLNGYYLLFLDSYKFYAIKETDLTNREEFEVMLKEKVR